MGAGGRKGYTLWTDCVPGRESWGPSRQELSPEEVCVCPLLWGVAASGVSVCLGVCVHSCLWVWLSASVFCWQLWVFLSVCVRRETRDSDLPWLWQKLQSGGGFSHTPVPLAPGGVGRPAGGPVTVWEGGPCAGRMCLCFPGD